MKLLVVVLFVVFVKRTFGISITFDPAKPALGDTVTISCKRSSSSSASVSWLLDSGALTTCSGSTNNNCIPSPTGYTVSTDVSADIFNLSRASLALTDCKTYTCTDVGTPSDTDSKDLSIAKYDPNEINLMEPGSFSSGTITLTTGCLLSPSDVTISWKKVKENNVEEDLDEVTPSQTTDATGCTDSCHSETSQKVVSSFEHNEYTESDSEEVIFRAYIRHSSYPESTKDSMKYKVKKATTTTSAPPAPVSDCECCLNCNIPLPGCIFLWILIGVGIACLISAVVILILRFVVGVRFPCGILNCENKKTSPKDSKTGKTKSTAGNTQPPKDEVNEDLVMEDKKETRVDFDKSSAGHTKKRPPAKLDQLNEPGSEKHHIVGRPLPDIGKYN